MRTIYTFFAMLTLALNSGFSFAESAPKNIIKGGKNTVCMSYEEASNGRFVKLIAPKLKAIYPKELKVQYIQTGLWVSVYFSAGDVQLPYSFEVGNDASGFEKNANRYCISQFDFDNDGILEIILAVVDPDVEGDGDIGFAGASVNVFKFSPPLFEKDATRKENWQLIGKLTSDMVVGNVTVKIKPTSITIPRNFRGFFHEIT